jgi:hypothetical protein
VKFAPEGPAVTGELSSPRWNEASSPDVGESWTDGAAKTEAMTRGRSAIVWSLVVVATLLTLVASMTVWTKRQLLDTDKWTDSATELLANDTFRTALSTRLTQALNQRVDVTAQLEERLPPRLQSAAPAIAASVQNAAARVIDTFLASAPEQELWERANRRAHGAIVNVLEGKDAGPISTANGDVVLDLRPLIQRVATRLGIENRLKEGANPNAGQIVILRSDQLDAAQTAVKTVKKLSVWIALIALALYALAVYLARGRRRVVLEGVGTGLLIVGLILLVVRRVVGNVIVDDLVKVDANRPAVHLVWAIETDLLRDIAIALVVYGLIASRRAIAPSFREHPVVVFGVFCLIFLLVVAFAPISAGQRWVALAILFVLLLFGLELWRRQTVAEFPGEGAPPAEPEEDPEAPKPARAGP